MSNLSHYIIEDVNSLYSSIYLSEETEIDEIDAFAGDVYAFVAHSMLHEGYSASGILGFLSTAPDEEILEKFGDYNENFIAESTISEEYLNEQVEQLDEFVGAALRILSAGAKAAKYTKGAKGLAPLSRLGSALKGAGTATTRVSKQGPGASSVVRAGLSKVKNAASAGLSKLKGAVTKRVDSAKGAVTSNLNKVKNATVGDVARGTLNVGKNVLKATLPGAVGFALGRISSGDSGDKGGKAGRDAAANMPKPPKNREMANIPPGEGTVNNPNYGKPGTPTKPTKPPMDSGTRTPGVPSTPRSKPSSSTPVQKSNYSGPGKPASKPDGGAKPASKEDAMAAWAAANPKLAAAKAERDRTRGTKETTNPLMQDVKYRLPDAKPAASKPVQKSNYSGPGKVTTNPVSGRGEMAQRNIERARKGNQDKEETKKESYDLVLDYLFSEGHADTVEEAHYIMLRLEADHVQEIVESYS